MSPRLRMLVCIAPALVAGCAATPGPIFPDLTPPVVWPKPPDAPRIRYVGQISGEANLGRKPGGLAALKALFEGPPPTVSFSAPAAVAVAGDLVFVADGQLGAVHRLDLAARTFRLITAAAGELLEGPIDLAVCDDQLAVADSRRGAVFLYTLDGTFVRTIGQAALARPTGLAWNATDSALWVVDSAAHACVVFDLGGRELRRFGGRGLDPGQYNFPAGIALHPEFGVAVADAMNFRVQLLTERGEAYAVFGKKGDAAGDFSLPRSVDFDSEGHVYVLDNQFENIQVFDRDGQLLMAFGHEGPGLGEFALPSGITIDAQDRIWVADTYNRRVQVFQYLPEEKSWQ